MSNDDEKQVLDFSDQDKWYKQVWTDKDEEEWKRRNMKVEYVLDPSDPCCPTVTQKTTILHSFASVQDAIRFIEINQSSTGESQNDAIEPDPDRAAEELRLLVSKEENP